MNPFLAFMERQRCSQNPTTPGQEAVSIPTQQPSVSGKYGESKKPTMSQADEFCRKAVRFLVAPDKNIKNSPLQYTSFLENAVLSIDDILSKDPCKISGLMKRLYQGIEMHEKKESVDLERISQVYKDLSNHLQKKYDSLKGSSVQASFLAEVGLSKFLYATKGQPELTKHETLLKEACQNILAAGTAVALTPAYWLMACQSAAELVFIYARRQALRTPVDVPEQCTKHEKRVRAKKNRWYEHGQQMQKQATSYFKRAFSKLNEITTTAPTDAKVYFKNEAEKLETLIKNPLSGIV